MEEKMNLAESVWESTLPILKEELSTATYCSYIEDLKVVDLRDRLLILETDEEFVKKMLTDRYAQTIEDALYRAGGREYKIKVVMPGEMEVPSARQEDETSTSINPKYTFDTFIIGSSNKFAHAAAVAVAQNPGKRYNPLFIYGDVGLGKTHLLHAVGNAIADATPTANIMYVTSEKFTNELIFAIRNDKNEEFRKKYRSVDVLMVDDIQFLSNKEGTQEEFFHTFNALYEHQKQIIISSDKPPREIPALEERLCSRFGWGLVADIQKPDYETRIAILEKKAITENMQVPGDVLRFIAEHTQTNIRELEGSLTRVMAHSELRGVPVSVELAAEALKDSLTAAPEKPVIDIPYIQSVVTKHFKLSPGDLSSKRRSAEVVTPRQIAMYLCRTLTDASLEKIGECFGGRHYSTVIHAVDKVTEDIAKDPVFASEMDDIKRKIEE
ncbi:MAG: chromosomal replication initiator protein DnaA [Christensenellales bacterium]|jgi:chromosomal replication initiator protein